MDDSQEIARISSATGFSEDAVRAMAGALRAGNGTMAQFSHSELGGFGQWSAGGMLMIGDMFNNALKGRVATLADMVSHALSQGNLPMRSAHVSGFGFGGTGQWWPDELGQPSSSGAQNGIRYAIFPNSARLAIETGGKVTIYDTGEHRIGGVSQQQGGTSTLRFSSQIGSVEAGDLKIVETGEANAVRETSPNRSMDDAEASSARRRSPDEERAPPADGLLATQVDAHPASTAFIPQSSAADTAPGASLSTATAVAGSQTASHDPTGRSAERTDDPLGLLRKLAELKNEGILTEEEFATKKAEILARI